MAITNPSFEDALAIGGIDRPGLADAWLGTNGGTSWEWAVFDSGVFIGEDFEINWSSNHLRKTELTSSQLDAATFDSTTPEIYEDFEEEWSSNENRKTELADSQLDAATFDTTVPEAFEDFEEEWSSNEDRRTVFGGGELDSALFQLGAGTAVYERFDDGDSLAISATTGLGAANDLDITQENRITFGGTFGGTDSIELQVQRAGFASWETYDTVTTTTEVNLPAGYKSVRTNRTVNGGGSPTAQIDWPELTQL